MRWQFILQEYKREHTVPQIIRPARNAAAIVSGAKVGLGMQSNRETCRCMRKIENKTQRVCAMKNILRNNFT